MTTHPNAANGLVRLASGRWAAFDGGRPVAKADTRSAVVDAAWDKGLMLCSWLVRVASGNPEPDSIEDTYMDVDCGAVMRPHPGYPGTDAVICDHGHERLPLEIEWAPGGPAWEREARERFEETGSVL